MIVYYQRRGTVRPDIKRVNGKELDHIVPYCLSLDNSDKNVQLLTRAQHRAKNILDRSILNEFKKEGWIESLRWGCLLLNKPQKFLIEEYKKRFSTRQVRQERHECLLKSPYVWGGA